MSKHDEAELILKLYDLRREEKMRAARDWYFREFNPQSLADIEKIMFSEQGAYARMVMSYWDMAAALVNHGAISPELFNDTNGEHIGVYAKLEPLLTELRGAYGPDIFKNLQKLIESSPGGAEKVEGMKARMKAILEKMAGAKAESAKRG